MKDLIERKEQLKETLVSISKSQVPQLKESEQTTPREISIVNNDNIKSIAKLPRY